MDSRLQVIAGRPVLAARVEDELEIDDAPEGSILDGLKRLALVAIILLFVFAAAIAAGRGFKFLDDANDAVLTSKIAAEAAARKQVGPYDYQRALSMPIRPSATVCQAGAAEKPRCRYYFGKDPA